MARASGITRGVPKDTGLPESDAQFDFARTRRARALARLRDAPARRAERRERDPALRGGGGRARPPRRAPAGPAGDPARLDRRHGRSRPRVRPQLPPHLAARCGTRWERVAAAQRRGEAMPPIDVYRIGELHFVKDGHHRVSVARALGHKDINAYVTEVLTEVGAEREITLADLPLKSHERLFRERVPLPERGARGDPALGRVALRRAGRGRGGLGLPARAGHRRGAGARRRWPRPGSARSTSRWWRCSRRRAGAEGHRHRGLHARLPPALPDPAHPRLGRRA